MAEVIINSFYSRPTGLPATGLSPKIRIWEVNGSDQTLVIGAPEGTGDPGPAGGGASAGPGAGFDGTMVEIFDKTVGVVGGGGLPIGGSRDGFYKYTFDTFNGFDDTKTYLVRTDGGATLPAALRFQVVRIDPSNFVDLSTIPDSVWEANPANYPPGGSPLTMGGTVNNIEDIVENIDTTTTDIQTTVTNIDTLVTAIDACVDQIKTVDLPAIFTLLECVRKYDTNRTRIDPVTFTLTIFDDDCVTPLRVFRLFDHNGQPSITNVCERKPSTASDGKPVCP